MGCCLRGTKQGWLADLECDWLAWPLQTHSFPHVSGFSSEGLGRAEVTGEGHGLVWTINWQQVQPQQPSYPFARPRRYGASFWGLLPEKGADAKENSQMFHLATTLGRMMTSSLWTHSTLLQAAPV